MEPTRLRMLRSLIVGGSLAVFCVIFTVIYEHFSHGAVSSYMRCMFFMPLVGCALPALVGLFTPLHRWVSRAAYNLWNSGLALWTVGCLFRGIVNISGRYTDLDRVYRISGWIFLAAAVLIQCLNLISRMQSRKKGEAARE